MLVAVLGALAAASAEEDFVGHIGGIGRLLLINIGDPGFAKVLAYRSLG